MNKLGLTDDGPDYIRELMKKGMIVDLSHMSGRKGSKVIGPELH